MLKVTNYEKKNCVLTLWTFVFIHVFTPPGSLESSLDRLYLLDLMNEPENTCSRLNYVRLSFCYHAVWYLNPGCALLSPVSPLMNNEYAISGLLIKI